MPVYCEINGVPHKVAKVSITWSLKQRATAEVFLWDMALAYAIEVGQRVEIGDDTQVLFGGTIHSFNADWLPGSGHRGLELLLVSYEQIPSRRSTGQRHYDRQAAGTIMADLVAQCLTGEGVDASEVLAGPMVGPFDFDYATVEEAFDQVSAAAGYYWSIEYNRHLRFFSRTTYPAPWAVTATQSKVRAANKIRVSEDRDKLVTRCYVRLGQYIGDVTTETYPGDGTSRQFNLTSPVGSTPTVRVDGVEKTVGVLAVDTGKQWYWQLGTATIEQDASEAALTSGNNLAVDYAPLSTLVVMRQNNAAIAARAAIEGMSGVYDKIIDASSPTTRWDGEALAQAELDRGTVNETIQIETGESDLRVGQLLTITLPAIGVAGTFLIDQLTMEMSIELSRPLYRASCSIGALTDSWQQVFGGTGGTASSVANSQVSSVADEGRIAYA